jgi:plastocyanin
MWTIYEGKYIVWTGQVETTSTQEDHFYVRVKHCPDGSGVTVLMRDDQRDPASRLVDGDTVTYKARLSRWSPGEDFAAEDGEIVSTGARPFDVSIFAGECTPAQVTVDVGSTVTWTNKGPSPAQVLAEDWSFDSGTLEVGQSYSLTFAQPGTFYYSCPGWGAVTAR